MGPDTHRIFTTEDVLHLIVENFDASEAFPLTQVPPFREIALNKVYHNCDDIERWLAAICHDRSALPTGLEHRACVGRPPVDEKKLKEIWDQTQFCTSRTQAITFVDSDRKCRRCRYRAASALAALVPSPLFPRAMQATCTISTMQGLELFALRAIFPRTMTKIHVSTSPKCDHDFLMTVLQGFPVLEDLHVSTRRDGGVSRLPLLAFAVLPHNLRALRIEDTHAVDFTAETLQEFLGSYPRLEELFINPSPATTLPREELPDLRCLETLLTQPHPYDAVPPLKRFGALLRIDPVLEALPPQQPSCLRELDLGWSRSCGDMTHVKAYVRHLFPRVLIRAMSIGVAQI